MPKPKMRDSGQIEIEDYGNVINDAFHGTSLEVGQNIDRAGFDLSHSGDDNYLGRGIYFFTDGGKWNATHFARRRFLRRKIPIAVIQSRVRMGRCLNFDNNEHRQVIKHVASIFKAQDIPTSDAQVINVIASNTSIDTVKATEFRPDVGTIFESSRFYDYTKPMICVRNLSCILGRKIAHTEMKKKEKQ